MPKERTFRVVSDNASRHQIILALGGLEGFLAEMAVGQFRNPADAPVIGEVAGRSQPSFTGSRLSAG